MTSVLKALALYNNEAEDADELSFKINDLLIILKEDWQDGWHLCQLGDKKGVAPSNYLQILVKPMNANQNDDSIYDSPKALNLQSNLYINNSTIKSPVDGNDMYVYSDYQNMQGGNEEEDIYMNTSSNTLRNIHDSRSSLNHLSPSPKRTTPPEPRKINYPAAPINYNQSKILQHQTSEYMDMDSVSPLTDYSEINDEDVQNDYDEVPSNDVYDSGAINKSSNESMKSSSSQIYPMNRSNESLHSNKISSESIRSYDSGISSSQQESATRESPPSLPSKESPFALHHSPNDFDQEPEDIYLVPPTAMVSLNNHENKRRSDHTYFSPPTPTSSVPPAKPILRKKSSQTASEVVMLDEGVEYMKHTDTITRTKKPGTPNSEKKKKKTAAGVDKLLSNLTLKKNKENKNHNGGAGGGGLAKSRDTLSKSLEHISKHAVSSTRPLPTLPFQKTVGEPSRGAYQKKTEYRERPLPPTPPDHELQDYAEIEDGPEYVEVPTPVQPPSSSSSPFSPEYQTGSKVGLERQRSKSVTSALCNEAEQERRHSSPNRPDNRELSVYDGCSYVTHDPGPLEDDDFHDYTEVPDLDGVPSSYHSNSSGYHSNSSGYHSGGSSVQSRHHLPGSLDSCKSLHETEDQYRPPLPASQPPQLPASQPPHIAEPTRPPPQQPARAKHEPARAQQPSARPAQEPARAPPKPPSVDNIPPHGVQMRPVAQVSPIIQIAPVERVSPVVRSMGSSGSSTPGTAGSTSTLGASSSSSSPSLTPRQAHQVCGIVTPSPPTFYSPTTLAKLPTTTVERAESVSPAEPMYRTQSYTPYPHHLAKPPIVLVEIDISSLCENDLGVIREHCGVISSALIRAATESLIKLKFVTDNRDVENYVAACTATGGACIEIIKHLTVLADKCQNPDLYNLTFAHKTKLREIVKRLVEAVKMAKVQYPDGKAHEDMLSRRNELITAIREIKTFVVKLLHPPT